jgi:hypothetical protein
MADNLAGIGGFAGAYYGMQDRIRQQDMENEANQIRNATGAISLAGLLQQQQARQQEVMRQQKLREELGALGPNSTPEQRIGVAYKYATPDHIVQYDQAALSRRDATESAERARRPEIMNLIEMAGKLPEGHPYIPAIQKRIDYLGGGEGRAQSASPLQRLINERDAIPVGDPRRTIYDNAIRKESETSRQISPTIINPPQEPAPVAVVKPDGSGVELVSRKDAIGRIPANMDPETQGSVAGARRGALVTQKLLQDLPQARLRVGAITQNLDRLDTAINELVNDKGLTNITGTLFGRTPNVTNTATGAKAKLNSIKSQIFQSSLQAMREASKTGGAVGNVSDREGDKLERTLAALDQAQSTEDFKKQAVKAVEQLRLSKALIKNAFDEQFGGIDEQVRPAPSNPAPKAAPRRFERLN